MADQAIAFGADINAKYRGGQTALCIASKSGQTELAKFLIANEIDINTRDHRYLYLQ